MSEQTPNTAANDVEQLIRDQIKDNKVILYMKGTPQFPQCGFSARSIEVLTQIGRPFAFVNILENPEIRAGVPVFKRPTGSFSSRKRSASLIDG